MNETSTACVREYAAPLMMDSIPPVLSITPATSALAVASSIPCCQKRFEM